MRVAKRARGNCGPAETLQNNSAKQLTKMRYFLSKADSAGTDTVGVGEGRGRGSFVCQGPPPCSDARAISFRTAKRLFCKSPRTCAGGHRSTASPLTCPPSTFPTKMMCVVTGCAWARSGFRRCWPAGGPGLLAALQPLGNRVPNQIHELCDAIDQTVQFVVQVRHTRSMCGHRANVGAGVFFVAVVVCYCR